MSFYIPEALYLLLALPLFFLFKKINSSSMFDLSPKMEKKIVLNRYSGKKEDILLSFTFIMLVIALARPISYKHETNSSNINVDMAVAIDISRSMMCEDIYPSRFEFAKNKLNSLIAMLTKEKVALLGFSNQPYIISPLTNNYEVLNYLVGNLKLNNINQKGTELLKVLETSDELIGDKKKKAVILFTDGTENKDFYKEIDFANRKNISLFIYNIGTKNGGVIKEGEKLVKDKNGNIVITRINENIKELADATDGEYLKYSLNSDDIKGFVDRIKKEFNQEEISDEVANNSTEFFYIPLVLAFISLILARVSLRGIK